MKLQQPVFGIIVAEDAVPFIAAVPCHRRNDLDTPEAFEMRHPNVTVLPDQLRHYPAQFSGRKVLAGEGAARGLAIRAEGRGLDQPTGP